VVCFCLQEQWLTLYIYFKKVCWIGPVSYVLENAKSEELRRYAVNTFVKLLSNVNIPDSLVQLAVWVND
jgi:hypothetical protein